MISLDIFADPVCPWCLIGKAELDRALESRPDHPFAIVWHPFRLNPTMPPEGMDRAEYLRAKMGDRADEMARALAGRCAALGIDLNPSDREPDTTDAHRLMQWADLEGAQTPVMSGLLRAYWLQAQDIGRPEVLVAVAAGAGMDADLITRLLAGDADRAEVERRDAHARKRGVTAVPTFIVADRHVISGAQPAGLWQDVIEELASASS